MPAPRQFVNGNHVYGAAAQQHIIKKNGGWDNFVEKISRKAADEAVRNVIDSLEQEFARPKLRRAK